MERPALASLPTTPGVYLYKDSAGRIIYVGKAINLRKRVLSYFRPIDTLPAKTAAMLRHAASLDTLSTGTEKEALLLEASLIKKHRPHYNIVLRDDKQYVLFRLARNVLFPRLEVVRNVKKDGARYFGPFTSATAARETLKTIHRTFPLRRCTDRAFANRVRPCLYYHMGQCLAPCTEPVSPSEYAVLTQRVEMLLAGRSHELVDTLTRAMHAASDAMDFENAATLRDQIQAIRKTVEKQSVVLSDKSDMDIVGIAPAAKGLAMGLLFVREGCLVDGRTFFWHGLELDDGPELVRNFLVQFYGAGGAVPPRIVVPWLPEEGDTAQEATDVDSEASEQSGDVSARTSDAAHDARGDAFGTEAGHLPKTLDTPADQDNTNALNALEALLADARGGTVKIALPRNTAEVNLVNMACTNARESTKNRDETPLGIRLARCFRVEQPLNRVECVDVSHTGGRSTRVGMVVFEEGQPLKSAYRTYTISDEDGRGDDYAALAAWAKRRVNDGPPWADLLLIDGGRGQISTVQRALREALALQEHGTPAPTAPAASATPVASALPTSLASAADTQGAVDAQSIHRTPGNPMLFVLAGIAKARNEAGHADRRAGNVSDRIFLPGRINPLPLREGSLELLFLQQVRDATHHYVLGKHRKARSGAALEGELLRIPGIGKSTAALLWKHFSSLEAITHATAESLAAIPGIGPRKAKSLTEKLAALRDPA